MINRLTKRADEQVEPAHSQFTLAKETVKQAAVVARAAENTARHINSVSKSTGLVKESMEELTITSNTCSQSPSLSTKRTQPRASHR